MSLGQVGVIPGADSLFQWGICVVTHSRVHHVVIDVGMGMVVSANLEGVQLVPKSTYPTAIWSDFQMTWADAAAVAKFARTQVGKPYAYADDALIAIERIFRFRFPKDCRQQFEDDGQWQCAQLADAALMAGGIDAFPDHDVVGDVSPGDFEQLFIAKHWHASSEFDGYKIWPW